MACNFNSCINTEGLLSETGSDVGYTAQYVHGSISKKMQDRDVVTPSAGWMTYSHLRADCLMYTGIGSGPNAR